VPLQQIIHISAHTTPDLYIISKERALTMAKRPAEGLEDGVEALKGGQRPLKTGNGEEMDFEDEFEDEYESEDEVFEAGVDGRPDEEREAEERRGTWITP
jgi:hypothetical protein